MIKFGIVQGRLSKAPKNRLQNFPKKYLKEFKIAKETGFDFIEFFSERKLNKKNPIWNLKKIDEIKKELKKNNLISYSFCDDWIISNDLRKIKTLNYYEKLINNIELIKIKYLILPMYGKSEINYKNYKSFLKNLNLIASKASKKKIKILMESNIDFLNFKKIVKNINKKIYFLYDLGNRSTLEINLYDDIKKFGKHIGHVHIKDKNFAGKNVKLNSGKVDFKKAMNSLRHIKYKKNCVFESIRGNDPVKTAKNNLNLIKSLI